MAKPLFKIIVPVIIIASGVYLATRLSGNKAQTSTVNTTTASSNQETAVDSPDAKKTLTMLEQKGKDSVTYLFFVTNNEDKTKNQIFSKTVDPGQTLFIPHNTWSPDYKYLFLKQGSPTQNQYIVLTSSGAPLSKDTQIADIGNLFEKKHPDYTITDVTGWAAPTLIIVNTTKIDGTQGPSFWFEIPSLSFIQLSSHFY